MLFIDTALQLANIIIFGFTAHFQRQSFNTSGFTYLLVNLIHDGLGVALLHFEHIQPGLCEVLNI